MIKNIFFKFLSLCFLAGAIAHLADLFDLRLVYSEMSPTWRVWTVSLLICDLLAAVGLWWNKIWGVFFFLVVSTSQFVAYLGYPEIFGQQLLLIWFHMTILTIYAYILFVSKDRDEVQNISEHETQEPIIN